MDNDDSFIKYVPIRSIISSLPGNFLLLEPDAPNFTVIDATDAYCQATYTEKDNIKGKHLFDVFPEKVESEDSVDDLRRSLIHVLKSRKTDQMMVHKYAIRNPQTGTLEERFWTLLNIPLLNDEGHVCMIIHSAVDVTSETLLRKSEQKARQKERFYDLMMQAPIAMCLLEGPDLIIESANKIILNMWAKTEEAIGQSLYEVLPELRQKQNTNDIITAYKTGKPVYGYQEEISIKKGSRKKKIFINYVCQPLFEEGKKPSGVLVILYDVTGQVLAAKRVEESENKLRSLIEQSTCAISLLRGEDMVFEIANKRAMDSLWSGQEIIGESMFDVLPHWARDNMAKIVDEIYKKGHIIRGYEAPWYNNQENPDDVKYYTYSIYPLIEAGAITGTIIMATEVTEHVLIKKKVQESEERLRAAAEAAGLGFWNYDLITGEMEWDNRCKELYGLPADAHVDYSVWQNAVHPDDREEMHNMVEWARNPLSGGHYDVEHRNVNGAERWVRAVGKVLFDEEQRPYRFTGTTLDISDKKKEEIRKNDFITMASHELKTPLTSMKAYIQILIASSRKANNEFYATSLTKVEAQINKINRMINDFLDLSRMELGTLTLNRERFELNEVIQESIEEIRPIVTHHNITFIPVEPVFLYADRQKIEEVILNFLNNAVKYSENFQPITVNVKVGDNFATVSVIDEGIGIPREDLDKVFDRFYRSERASKHGFSGFGIGLYISAEIIQRHNGSIGVKSEEGKGSEFHFTLPLAPESDI
ncbi:MAG TPA: ATP-binding protein [Sphingobacteriaceae bacterium]